MVCVKIQQFHLLNCDELLCDTPYKSGLFNKQEGARRDDPVVGKVFVVGD
jgi:hypothetical protein